ncbi:SDR family oxidoreductase [Comamonas sp. NLF-1-9]|uniref:SDR family oxidoreductase n=1 Tax=Comamonas sp. NLF-1-9 TaxID=2853163 RepID=UPI001C437E57|nr:SDR family oxidoreductase [Comamonas sp. NLF-1-9]QXL85254.1 SDR family oxidoreductase [Comamonas sp. NLF-1-9]
MSTAGRVALITGAGSGIGRAAALALARAGWRLVLAGRRPEPLQALAQECGGEGAALALPTDVADPAAVRRLFDASVQHYGRVDLLFNNAGTGAPAVPLQELEVRHWQQVVDVNLSGMFYCIQNAFRVMAAQTPRGGRIINNGSISAHAPRPHSIAYTATKHAVTGLTKSAALDGRAYDIAVGQIDVGNADTALAQQLTQGVLQAHGAMADEPLMDVDIVGASVLYMAELPLSANVLFHTVMATKMPFVGRG